MRHVPRESSNWATTASIANDSNGEEIWILPHRRNFVFQRWHESFLPRIAWGGEGEGHQSVPWAGFRYRPFLCCALLHSLPFLLRASVGLMKISTRRNIGHALIVNRDRFSERRAEGGAESVSPGRRRRPRRRSFAVAREIGEIRRICRYSRLLRTRTKARESREELGGGRGLLAQKRLSKFSLRADFWAAVAFASLARREITRNDSSSAVDHVSPSMASFVPR